MLIPQLHAGAGALIGPLTVFPVWTDHGPGVWPPGPDRREAEVHVTEVDPPAVEHLLVSNTGETDVVLIEGEVLEGGQQHRVVSQDVIILAGTSRTVDVTCVEQGRWSHGFEHHRGKRRAPVRVREALLEVDAGSRQSQVWQRVADYDGALVASPTESLLDHLDALSAPTGDPTETAVGAGIDEVVTTLSEVRPLPGQSGILVGIAGQPVLLELFPDPTTLADHVHGTLTGLLLDAVASHQPWLHTPSRRARRLAARLSGLDLQERTPPTGAGRSFEGAHHTTAVRGIEHNGAWAHLTAVNRDHPLLRV